MIKVPFVDLTTQYQTIKEDIDRIVFEVIENSSFIGGQHVNVFEEAFAVFIGIKHCIGVGNCTDALFIALKCLGVGPGDEVITVANSFVATSEAITMCGAKPVFVDCDPNTYNINVSLIEKVITPRTKAIIPVHLYGQPADMDSIMELGKQYNLRVVEDAAQAHGAQYKGNKVGQLGDCACFSFYPGKNLGAYGDAGAIVTKNTELATRIRMFANHGRKEKYNHEFEGVNSRLDALQAAVLKIKLGKLDEWNERRRTVASKYNESLAKFVTIPSIIPNTTSVYHLYVVQVSKRDYVQQRLAECGISTGIHYPIPLPFLKAYEYLGHRASDFPITNTLKDNILSLPIHGNMPDDQIEYVIDKMCNIMKECGSNK